MFYFHIIRHRCWTCPVLQLYKEYFHQHNNRSVLFVGHSLIHIILGHRTYWIFLPATPCSIREYAFPLYFYSMLRPCFAFAFSLLPSCATTELECSDFGGQLFYVALTITSSWNSLNYWMGVLSPSLKGLPTQIKNYWHFFTSGTLYFVIEGIYISIDFVYGFETFVSDVSFSWGIPVITN